MARGPNRRAKRMSFESIKSRIEALDGNRKPLVNDRCFAAVTGDVADCV